MNLYCYLQSKLKRKGFLLTSLILCLCLFSDSYKILVLSDINIMTSLLYFYRNRIMSGQQYQCHCLQLNNWMSFKIYLQFFLSLGSSTLGMYSKKYCLQVTWSNYCLCSFATGLIVQFVSLCLEFLRTAFFSFYLYSGF